MMGGFNVESTRALAEAINTPVFASGGMATLDDIRSLKALEEEGVCGAIIGRALYEGRFTLADAIKIVK
jgi:phosphoribosylformimino-5-aminoimidazole carboxamide ribotide isomerase